MGTVAVTRLGVVEYREALRLQEILAEARRRETTGDLVLLLQHPPTVTLGRGGGSEDILAPRELLCQKGIAVHETDRGGRATYHGPGQLVVYPIFRLPDGNAHVHAWRLEETVIRLLAGFGLRPRRLKGHPGVWVDEKKIAAIGIAVSQGVTTHGLALNVDPLMEHFQVIVPCGIADKGVTSMRVELGRAVDFAAVEEGLLKSFAGVFDVKLVEDYERPLPLKPGLAGGSAVEFLLEALGLNTVCQSAGCPNIGECFAHGTATFMILGSRCTRGCRFCAVEKGTPSPPDRTEPRRVALAAAQLGLRHVVITSVTRDDLSDGGAGHFVATVLAVRELLPRATVEVLVPDFRGSLAALEKMIAVSPEIFNHNLETVPRLYPQVRPGADYQRSLGVLAFAHKARLVTKSGLMLGLGETQEEVLRTMRDLRRAGCQILTLGQYLQPTSHHLEVAEYLAPEKFRDYQQAGKALGFSAVIAGPFVRSSYHAAQVQAEYQP